MSISRRLLILAVVAVMPAAMAAAASAAPPDCDAKPDHPACRDEPPPAPNSGRTCQEVHESGALWILGGYENGVYTGTIASVADGNPLCFDIRSEHYTDGPWTISWNVEEWSSGVGSIKGFLFVFEQGLGGIHYDEHEVVDPGPTDSRTTTLEQRPVEGEPFNLLIMWDPRRVKRGDTYAITFTVTPPGG